jgi:eukaryotic-like serine/threonine-protein kinase
MSGPAVASEGGRTRDQQLIAGKYRLERTLGEGGMGVVYAAEHVDLQKRVAIKVMRDELTSQGELVERMLAEARTVARLRSEHVAQVIDVGRLSSGAPFIVMEYLDGCDLGTKLASGEPLPTELTVAYVLQACEAVAEAHAAGIVHRDIKPENLFLSARTDGEPIIKVLDFGISRSMKSGEREPVDTLIAGSPDYMSPEAMRPETRVAPATDIWSLGAVLYEMITGRRPFEAATVAETCARVLGSKPVAPSTLAPSVPAGLERVVLRCLSKQASERFGSVVDLAAALAPFGPEGAIEQAERVARVASGGRWNPRSTTSPKRLSFPSFSDVPNSTSAVVAEPPPALAASSHPLRRRRWQTKALVFLAAVAAVGAVAFRAHQSAPLARPQVVAVAAPAVADAPPLREAAASAAPPESATATAVVRAPINKGWAPQKAKPIVAASASSAPSATFTYEDEGPAPSATELAPRAAEPGPTEPKEPPTAPKIADSAPVEIWSPDGL